MAIFTSTGGKRHDHPAPDLTSVGIDRSRHEPSRRYLKWVALACVLAFPLAFPTAAYAADDKTMPGSECVPGTGNNPDGVRFVLDNSTFFYADSRGPLRADCPIVKERIGKGILSASVFVIDNNPSEDIKCELFSRRIAPGQVPTGTASLTRSTDGSSTRARELKLGGLPAVPGAGSYWFIGCTLTPFTGILSYNVNEQQ